MNYTQIPMYINGEFIQLESRNGREILNPADNESIGVMPCATQNDLDLALEGAQTAFESWKDTSPLFRSDILR